VTGAAFSRLAAQLLNDHARRDDDPRLEVVPVICAPGIPIDDPGAAVLRDAVNAQEGIVLVARDLVDGVVGQRDAVAEKFERVVRDPLEPDRARVLIEPVGDRVVPRMSDGSASTGSGGTETLVGFGAALQDERLRRSEIAVLAYDEGVLDGSAAEDIWALVCLHLPGMDFGRLRTLIVLAHAPEISPGRHYGRFNSARYVLRPGGPTERRPWDVDREEIRRLSEEAQLPIVLFLGAGFSASSRTADGRTLPMGNTLRDRALRRLIGDFDSDQDAADKFRVFCSSRQVLLPGEETMSREEFRRALTFERVLNLELAEHPSERGPTLERFAEQVEEAKQDPGPAVHGLRELLAAGDRIVLVTVNFDELVEHVCENLVTAIAGEQAFEAAATVVRDYIAAPPGAVQPAPLLKLHGTLSDPDSLIATANSVALGLSEEKIAALEQLLGLDRHSPRLLFYVGASMRDRDISQLIGLRRYGERLEEWWVAPALDDSVETFINANRLRLWTSRGQDIRPISRCITVTADVFIAELTRHLHAP
jgi:hypothetical protein